ncbi:hypothetical protein CG427_13175 [Pantoea ananatis]|nr:hypothetical protein CG427_13175 [Pantoea ananatis]
MKNHLNLEADSRKQNGSDVTLFTFDSDIRINRNVSGVLTSRGDDKARGNRTGLRAIKKAALFGAARLLVWNF